MSFNVIYTFLNHDSTDMIVELKKCDEECEWRKYGYACFSSYNTLYRDNKDMFLSMKMPYWINKVVEEFNQTFNNIKIDIVGEKTFIYGNLIDSFGDLIVKDADKNLDCVPSEDFLKELEKEGSFSASYYPIFRISTSNKYDRSADKAIKHLVGVFLRILCYDEYFISHLKSAPTSNYIKTIIDFNNKNRAYHYGHCLCEENMKVEYFLLMDNIGFMNYIANTSSFGHDQTPIYNSIDYAVNELTLKFGVDISKESTPEMDTELNSYIPENFKHYITKDDEWPNESDNYDADKDDNN